MLRASVPTQAGVNCEVRSLTSCGLVVNKIRKCLQREGVLPCGPVNACRSPCRRFTRNWPTGPGRAVSGKSWMREERRTSASLRGGSTGTGIPQRGTGIVHRRGISVLTRLKSVAGSRHGWNAPRPGRTGLAWFGPCALEECPLPMASAATCWPPWPMPAPGRGRRVPRLSVLPAHARFQGTGCGRAHG